MEIKDKKYKHKVWLEAQVAAGLKTHEIAQMCGVKKATIAKWASTLKVPMVHWSARTRKYDMDHTFFNVIDTEPKAYALGLWAADGTVLRTGWEARLKLHQRDSDILRALQDDIEFTGPLRVDGVSRCLALCSVDIVHGLAAHGVHPNKTTTLQFPAFITDRRLLLHYLRGMFDGDGSIGKQVRLVTGSKPFVTGFQAWYTATYGKPVYTLQEDNIYRVVCNRRDAEFIHDMYTGATVYMSRKYASYLRHWRGYTYTGPRPKRKPYKDRKS